MDPSGDTATVTELATIWFGPDQLMLDVPGHGRAAREQPEEPTPLGVRDGEVHRRRLGPHDQLGRERPASWSGP